MWLGKAVVPPPNPSSTNWPQGCCGCTEGTVALSPTKAEQAPAQGRKLLCFNKIVKQIERSGHRWWKYFNRVLLRAWGCFVLVYSHIARGERSSSQVPQATRQKKKKTTTELVPQYSETFKQNFFDNSSSKSLDLLPNFKFFYSITNFLSCPSPTHTSSLTPRWSHALRPEPSMQQFQGKSSSSGQRASHLQEGD